jgi:hypothetical protein
MLFGQQLGAVSSGALERLAAAPARNLSVIAAKEHLWHPPTPELSRTGVVWIL